MKPNWRNPWLRWLCQIAAQAIEGAADAFLTVTGGNTAMQLMASHNATAESLKLPQITPAQLCLSMAVLAGIYVASFLKKNPLPAEVLSPPPAPAPDA